MEFAFSLSEICSEKSKHQNFVKHYAYFLWEIVDFQDRNATDFVNAFLFIAAAASKSFSRGRHLSRATIKDSLW